MELAATFETAGREATIPCHVQHGPYVQIEQLGDLSGGEDRWILSLELRRSRRSHRSFAQHNPELLLFPCVPQRS